MRSQQSATQRRANHSGGGGHCLRGVLGPDARIHFDHVHGTQAARQRQRLADVAACVHEVSVSEIIMIRARLCLSVCLWVCTFAEGQAALTDGAGAGCGGGVQAVDVERKMDGT